MSSIDQCRSNIEKYRRIINQTEQIVSSLTFASGSANNIENEIKSKYQLNDDYTPIVTKTNGVKEKIENTIKYLNQTILPALQTAIGDNNAEIGRIETQQRLEAERHQAELRRQEEIRRQEEQQRQQAAAQKSNQGTNNIRSKVKESQRKKNTKKNR